MNIDIIVKKLDNIKIVNNTNIYHEFKAIPLDPKFQYVTDLIGWNIFRYPMNIVDKNTFITKHYIWYYIEYYNRYLIEKDLLDKMDPNWDFYQQDFYLKKNSIAMIIIEEKRYLNNDQKCKCCLCYCQD